MRKIKYIIKIFFSKTKFAFIFLSRKLYEYDISDIQYEITMNKINEV
jgi:hypothetical protein